MEYKRYGTKKYSLQEVKSWNEGESDGLKELIGIGYYDHLFICDDGMVSFFYNYDEWEIIHEEIRKILTDRFFDEICRKYDTLINQINHVSSNKEIHILSVKLWPIQTIFNEIDEMPNIASKYILDRLLKIRTATHTKHYELEAKRRIGKEPKDYTFYKGKLYLPDNYKELNKVIVVSELIRLTTRRL